MHWLIKRKKKNCGSIVWETTPVSELLIEQLSLYIWSAPPAVLNHVPPGQPSSENSSQSDQVTVFLHSLVILLPGAQPPVLKEES